MKRSKLFLAMLALCLLGSSAHAGDIMKAVIPSGTPFGVPCCNFVFGEVAQKVNVSSSFTITNLSTLSPIVYSVTTSAPFSVTPGSGTLFPGKSVTVTVALNSASASLGAVNKQVLIVAKTPTQIQTISNWFASATIVPFEPDLSFTFSGAPGFSSSGANKTVVSLALKISNQRNLAPSNPCHGTVFLGNTNVATFDIAGITAGQSRASFASFETAKTGSQTIRVQIDSDNKNTELHEDNNEQSETVTIP
jgi:hypothetical protein